VDDGICTVGCVVILVSVLTSESMSIFDIGVASFEDSTSSDMVDSLLVGVGFVSRSSTTGGSSASSVEIRNELSTWIIPSWLRPSTYVGSDGLNGFEVWEVETFVDWATICRSAIGRPVGGVFLYVVGLSVGVGLHVGIKLVVGGGRRRNGPLDGVDPSVTVPSGLYVVGGVSSVMVVSASFDVVAVSTRAAEFENIELKLFGLVNTCVLCVGLFLSMTSRCNRVSWTDSYGVW
jgi:hypothetical protein